MKEHEVIVYDENGNELCKSIENINVTHLTRVKHVLSGYTTYSFNSHLNNGMVCWGLVSFPSFSGIN